MAYPVVDVTPHPQSFAPATNRPIRGGAVHNTVGATAAATRQFAGWHWQIDRNGTRLDTVSEGNVAYHVESTNRWRPPWIVPGPGGFSDANWCLLGVEFVSLAGSPIEPAGYERYTSDQYASGRELFAQWNQRYGDLPYVGHGEMQANRSDPVGFDWSRAGFGLFVPQWGRHFIGVPTPPPTNGGTPVAEQLLTDDELDADLAELVANFGAGQYVPAVRGIDREWRNQYRADRHRGMPVTDEVALTSGRFARVYAQGIAIYDPATGLVTWTGDKP